MYAELLCCMSCMINVLVYYIPYLLFGLIYSEIKSLEKELPAAKKSFADTEKELEKAIELEEKNTGEVNFV